jgi:hypothetical protein
MKLRKLDDEQWLDMPNSDGRYKVSNYGRIKSFSYNKTDGQIMKCHEIKGFKAVSLKINKAHRAYYVHKLVAEVWIPRPSDQHELVTHLDRNLKNNHVSNLAWITKEVSYKQNTEYFRQKRTAVTHRKVIHNSKLKEKDIQLLKSMLQKGVTQAKIAKMFCISEMQVTRIKRGENWGHVQPQN